MRQRQLINHDVSASKIPSEQTVSHPEEWGSGRRKALPMWHRRHNAQRTNEIVRLRFGTRRLSRISATLSVDSRLGVSYPGDSIRDPRLRGRPRLAVSTSNHPKRLVWLVPSLRHQKRSAGVCTESFANDSLSAQTYLLQRCQPELPRH